MIPDDPHTCKVLECAHLETRPLLDCEEAKCCWHYVRRREEDRVQREAKDRENPPKKANFAKAMM